MSEASESGSRPSEDGLRSDSYGIAQASIVADVRSLLAGWRRFERTDDETLRLIAKAVGYYIAPLVHAPDPRERRSSRDLQNTSAASPVPEEQPNE